MKLFQPSTVIKAGRYKITFIIDDNGKEIFILKEKDFWWFYNEVQRSHDLDRMMNAMGNYMRWERTGKKIMKDEKRNNNNTR